MRLLRSFGAFLLGLVACANLPAPLPEPFDPLPSGAVRASVSKEYEDWWRETESCSGKQGDYSQVQWYVVVAPSSGFRYRGTLVAGLAYNDRYAIVMGTPWILSKGHVTHEMLHLIASPSGHDPEYYLRRCSHLVHCFGSCRTDTLPTVVRGAVARHP